MAQHVDVIQLFTEAALEVDNRKLSNVTRETVISALGMDSVAVMELVSYFEEKLAVRIPDEDLNHIRTVGDLRDALAKLVPVGTTVA
jgi:acyl carrier protein